jgi:hypothetical protein
MKEGVFMDNKNKQGKSILPNLGTVAPTIIPPVPSPKKAAESCPKKIGPKPETTKDNLQYK